jgi:glucose dehydrogenase
MFVGHNDGSVEAYDETNGNSLWRGPTFPSAADAPPMTYTSNGKQYVAELTAGNNHENDPRGDLFVAYALP